MSAMPNSPSSIRACWALWVFAVVAIAALLSTGCTDDANTVRTLHAAGFTDVQTTGYSWFECGQDDSFHTGFRAKNPRGEWVSGTVCCGFMAKGCTVRF